MSIRRLAACALVLFSCTASGQELELLRRVRKQLAAEARRIPNYTCTERITRSVFEGSSRKLVAADRVRLEVAYVDGKELFAWPGEPFQHQDPASLIGTGLSGTGDFTTVLLNVFFSASVSFEVGGHEVFDGQKAVRFSYRVREPQWVLHFNMEEARVRFHGSFWISTETERLLALEAVAEDLPAALRISKIGRRIELQRVAIDGSEVTLPRVTLLTTFPLGAVSESEDTNRTEFENCRRYTAESTISFGEEEPAAEAAATSAESLRELPAGAHVLVALETPIDAATSAAGDAISAVVLKPVVAGRVRIPKGARLLGRLLLLQLDVKNACVTAHLDFSRIEAPGLRLLFRGHFRSLYWVKGLLLSNQLQRGRATERPATLILQLRNGLLRVPAGTEMEWMAGQPPEP